MLGNDSSIKGMRVPPDQFSSSSRPRIHPAAFGLSRLALALACAFAVTSAQAAGLGRMRVTSALGQPLRAEIDITAVAPDEVASLGARISSADVFEQSSLAYPDVAKDLRLTIETLPDGKRVVRLSSPQPVNDPYLDLMVELYWSTGRFLRQYTFLLDPPELRTLAPAPPESVISQVTLPKAAAPARASESADAGSSVATEASDETSSGSATGAPAARSSAATATASARKPTMRGAAAKPSARSGNEPQNAERAVSAGTDDFDGRVVVKPGDTLVGIANQFKPAAVDLDTMLVGLFRSNPQAFYDGNMNLLKAGAVLRLPDESVLSAIDPRQARQSVRAHVDDFYTYRKRLVKAAERAAPVKAGNTGAKATSGKISDEVLDKTAPEVIKQDQLKINHATGSGNSDAKTRQDLMAEELSSRDRALKEAQSRVTELERNVNDMRRLLEAQNKVLAEFEQRARQQAEAAASAAAAPRPEPAPTPTPAVINPPAEAATAPAQAQATAEPAPASPPATAPKPAAPAPALQPTSTPKAEDASVSPWLPSLASLALVVAAAFGWGYWRRRNALSSTETGSASVVALTPNVTPESAPETANSAFAPSMLDDEPAPGGGSDPLAEADVYIAYGRDMQAEEILKEGLRQTPARHALRLKLLEVYAARKDMTAFNTTMDEIETATGAQGEDWARAIAIGSVVDPENPRYADAATHDFSRTVGSGPAAFDDPEKTVRIDPAAREALMAMGPGVSPAEVADDSGQAQSEPSAANAQPANEDDAQMAQTAITPIDLDFDIDLTSPREPAPATDESDDAMARTSVDLNQLDIDVPFTQTLPSLPAGDAASSEPLLAPERMLEGLGDKSAASAAKSSPEDSGRISLNLPDTLDLDAAPASSPNAAEADAFATSSDNAAPLDITAQQEMSTKLDLASAYIDIGDKEGARELLQEVRDGGSAEQRQQAEQALAALA